MKKSYYTYFAPTKQGFIGYNTVGNSFVYLRREIYVNYYKSDQFVELENLFPVQYQQLIESGFLIDDDVNEFENLQKEYENQAKGSTDYELTLLPTLDSNLRCWYCYEKHIIGSRMSETVRDLILQHVSNVLDNSSIHVLKVTMYGGEPLLYFKEELYPLLKQIKQIAENREKSVSFFFVTNAVCIDDASIPLLKELNSNFQISIDGYKEKHDKVKFIPGSRRGTYDQVIETIYKLTEQIENVYINLRLNYDDETLLNMEQLVKDLLTVDRRKIGIHLERVWQTSGSLNPNNVQLKNVINLLLLNKFNVSYMNLFRKKLSCHSSMENQSVISYDGKVYKCTGRDFTDSFSEGRLQENGSIRWDHKALDRRMQICTYDNQKCRTCKFLPLCWGPCNQKLLESGVTEKSISQYCQLNLMEMPLDDYICYRFNNEVQRRNNYECS